MPSITAAPILCVEDVTTSCGLYERAFGFRRLRYFDGNDQYAVIERGGAQLHLCQGEAHPHHRQGSHVADAFVWVNDLERIIEGAHAAGLTSTRGPEHYDSTPVATTEVVYADTDGNWICFGRVD